MNPIHGKIDKSRGNPDHRTRHTTGWSVPIRLLLGLGLGAATVGCGSTHYRLAQATDASYASVLDTADPGTDVAPPALPETPAVAAAPRAPAPTFSDVQSAIRAVQAAATPDEALADYSAGLALDRDNVPLQEAYVRRMVDLNAPQLAEPAARRLVGVRPDSSLAWAVIAVSEAKRGNMVDALTDVAMATRNAADDPFVQRTAGEMLAWYDNVPVRPTLPAGIAADLDAARRNFASRPAYSDGYAKANAFYKNPPRPDAVAGAGQAGAAAGAAAPGTTAPATQGAPAPGYPASAPATAEAPYGTSPYPYSDPYGAVAPSTYVAPYPAYAEPYVPYAADYVVPAYGYPYPYYYSGWCPDWGFGFGASLVFVGGDWGWCGHGGFHHHWDGWGGRGSGRDFGHARDFRSFASAAGRNAVGRSTFAGPRGTVGNTAAGRGAVQAAVRGSRGTGTVGSSALARGASLSPGARAGYYGSSAASPRFGPVSPSYSYGSRLSNPVSPRFSTATPRLARPSYTPYRGSYGFSRAATPHYSTPSYRSFGGSSFRGGSSFHGGGGSFHGGGGHGGGGHR